MINTGGLGRKFLFICILPISSHCISIEKQNEHINSDTIVVEASENNPSLINVKNILTTGTNNADIFGSKTSLQINNSRNEGGAIDVGIRGLQNNGRVPIVIDDSLQSTNTWRGYQGSTDRTYIDMDLINTISVEKGVTAGQFGSGAIGGMIKIKTLEAKDIIPKGDRLGFLLKGNVFNNNRRPDIPSDDTRQSTYILSNGIKGNKFNNGSLTFGLAYLDADIDVIFAHSERYQGNYFSGKHGADKYQDKSPISPGQEVVNTSYESHSSILKTGLNLTPSQRVELNIRRHQQRAGEVLAAYWSKDSSNRDGQESMPQWELGSAIINAASFNYSYKPENLLIDFNMGMWWTTGKYNQHNGYAEDVGAKNAGQYFHTYDDDRKGINLTNTSSLSNTPVNLTYGIEITAQKIRPLNKRYQSIWTPQAIYPGDELLSAARNAQGIGKALFFNTEYDGDRFHALAGWRGHTFEINDKNQKYKIKYQEKNDIFGTFTLHIFKNIDLFTKLANTYRNPSLFESTVSGQTVSYSPNHPIKPEKLRSLEMGVKINKDNLVLKDDTFKMKISYFKNNIDNYLSQGRNPQQNKTLDAYIITKNYKKFTLSGYELEANYDSTYFFSNIDITLYNSAILCSKEEMNLNNSSDPCNSVGFPWGLTASRIPPKRNISAAIGIKLLDQHLYTGTRIRYNSGKKYPQGWLAGTAATPIERQYASTTFDFFAKYNITKDIDVSFNIDNLTNRYAFDPGSVIYMPIPGRTFRIGFEAKF